MPQLPTIIAKNGFTFSWDEKEVWKLDVPVETMAVELLEWHFDLPFWNEDSKPYSLSAREVMENPEHCQAHYKRILAADTNFPIDVAMHPDTGKWLILDGLHRLAKLHLEGVTHVLVRKIPLEMIPRK